MAALTSHGTRESNSGSRRISQKYQNVEGTEFEFILRYADTPVSLCHAERINYHTFTYPQRIPRSELAMPSSLSPLILEKYSHLACIMSFPENFRSVNALLTLAILELRYSLILAIHLSRAFHPVGIIHRGHPCNKFGIYLSNLQKSCTNVGFRDKKSGPHMASSVA